MTGINISKRLRTYLCILIYLLFPPKGLASYANAKQVFLFLVT